MESAYDVFVSYSSRDRPVVEAIAERLRQVRLTPWFDRWNLTAGRSWQEEIAGGIAASGACAVCVGAGDLGDWSRNELEVALMREANDRDFRVFIVLLPGIEEPFDPSRLSPFLTTRTWVDLRGGIADLQALISAVKGVPTGAAEAPAEQGRVPYRGLRAFEEDDADVFFGRAAETQRALEKLKAARFLAVVGASGSGKSSLVRAGLVPALGRGELPGSARWSVRVLKPGAVPLTALAAQVARLRGSDDVGGVLAQLRGGAEALHLLGVATLVDRPDDERIVLVVDQFEEVFTRCRDEAERRRFVESLVYAATAPDGRVVVVLTLRADFYQRCAAHPELGQLLTAHQALIGPMAPDALRQAIQEPARRAGGEFEAGLVELLISEVEGRPGALPLLEHTLLELWERRRGRMLTLEAYQQAGGVAGAVAHRAEEVYTGLTADEQAIARRVLLRLTEPGEGTEDTRRRAELAELARSADESAAVGRVVGALADARLVTTSTDEGDGEQVVDVSHEALIRGWPRLRGWIDDDREGLRIQRRVAETAEEWERLDRDPGLLFRGARLAEALTWREHGDQELNERERAFLDASADAVEEERSRELRRARELAAARERARRRLVWATVVLLAGVVASSVAAGVALHQRGVAEDERDSADEQATTALARQLAARAREDFSTHVDTALLRGLAATHLRPTAEIQSSLAGALDEEPRLEAVLRRGGPKVAALAGAPDGRSAVSVDVDGTVTRWDLKRRRAAGVLLRAGAVTVAAGSGDGKRLATAAADGRIRIWDLRSLRPITAATQLHRGPIYDLELSQTGNRMRMVTTRSGSRETTIWTVGPRLSRLSWVTRGGGVVAALAPDGEHAAVYEADGAVVIRDLRTRGVVARPGKIGKYGLWYTPDGHSLLDQAGEDTNLVLRDLGGRLLRRLRSSYRPLAATAHGAVVAVLDRGLKLRLARRGHADQGPLRGLDLDAVTADFAGDRLVTGNSQGQIALWRVTAEPAFASVWRLDGNWGAPRPDGRQIVVGAGDVRHLQVYDVTTRALLRELPIPPPAPYLGDIGVSPDGRFAALTTRQRSPAGALLWDVRAPAGSPPVHLGRDLGATSVLAFDPTSRSLAVGAYDGSVAVWDLSGATPVRRPGLLLPKRRGNLVSWLWFSRDGRSLLALSRNRFVRVDLRTHRLIEPKLPLVRDVSMSADDRLAAAVEADGSVSLWTAAWQRRGPALTRININLGAFVTLSLSRDGRRLAVNDDSGIVTVWDTGSRAKLGDINVGDIVDWMGWAGERLITSSLERISSWDLSLTGMQKRACAIANRNLTPKEWRDIVGPRPYQRLCPGLA